MMNEIWWDFDSLMKLELGGSSNKIIIETMAQVSTIELNMV